MRRQHVNGYFTLALSMWFWMTPSLADNPTVEIYEQAINRIITGFEQGSAEPFNQTIDVVSIADKATNMIKTDPDWISKFRSGLIQGLKTSMGEKLQKQIVPGSYIKLLRLMVHGTKGRALLRFDYGDQGNGYLDFMMTSTPEGEVRIVDWYDYGTGQKYTTSLQQIAGILAPSPTFLGKLYDVATDRKEVSDEMREMFKLYKQQKYIQLAKKFLAQDESIRRSRVLNLIAIQSANASGDNEIYRKVLANLEHFHGDDEKLFYILLDYYFLEEKYDRILSGLDRLEAIFGKEDAAMEVIRSNTRYAQGDFTGAGLAADRAVSLEPEYEYGYLSQLTARTALKDYAGGVKTAAVLEDRFGYDMSPESLGAAEEFTDLANSEAYLKWRADR